MNKDYGKGICVICGKEFEKKSENAFYVQTNAANYGKSRGIKNMITKDIIF